MQLYHSFCSLFKALEEAKNRDRLYIPSRYQLFTLNQVRQVCADAGNACPTHCCRLPFLWPTSA